MPIRDPIEKASATKRDRGRPREFDRDAGLRTAMELFWKKGYEAVSMADLRGALRITQASLYAAYGSKRQLFEESVALYLSTAGSTTSRALSADLSTRAAIEAMLRTAVENFLSRPKGEGGCLLVLGAVNCSEENAPVAALLREARLHNLKLIASRLRRGMRKGDVPRSAHVDVVANFYATVLHGLSIQARDGLPAKSLFGDVDSAMRAWPAILQS